MKKAGIFLLMCLCLFAAEMVHYSELFENLGDNLVRLHITANSDSEYDRNIKLKIRNALMESGEYDIDALDETANSTLKTLGADYSAKTVYRTRFVPEKQYKNLALPEGIYRCIDVVLGKGNGENWWCVAYPPLCFTEAVVGELSGDAKKELKSILSDEAFDTVLKDGEITYKFKILETYQKIKGWIR